MTSRPVVIFDIGGTLVNGPDRGPASRIASELGMSREHRRALKDALMTRPFEAPAEVAAFVREELGVDGAGPAVARIWDAQEREALPVPGALATLDALRAHGFGLALISNIWRPYLASVRRHFGAFFDRHIPRELQVFSFRAGRAKPSREMFERVVRAAGLAPHEAVMVGDSYDEDIVGAAEAGLRTIWIPRDGAAPRPGDPAAASTVRSIAEVDPELVSELVRGGGVAGSRG
jgi:HAD superfamily hydrolase (TIGR01509 family)